MISSSDHNLWPSSSEVNVDVGSQQTPGGSLNFAQPRKVNFSKQLRPSPPFLLICCALNVSENTRIMLIYSRSRWMTLSEQAWSSSRQLQHFGYLVKRKIVLEAYWKRRKGAGPTQLTLAISQLALTCTRMMMYRSLPRTLNRDIRLVTSTPLLDGNCRCEDRETPSNRESQRTSSRQNPAGSSDREG